MSVTCQQSSSLLAIISKERDDSEPMNIYSANLKYFETLTFLAFVFNCTKCSLSFNIMEIRMTPSIIYTYD